MKRSDKYPNTKWFTYYNHNPKSRITTDCVVRAISFASGISYADTLQKLCQFQIETGYDGADGSVGMNKFLSTIGFQKNAQPRTSSNTKYTGKEFCDLLLKLGYTKNVIANIGGHHVTAFIYNNGTYKCYDIWDPTDNCVGNFWTI